MTWTLRHEALLLLPPSLKHQGMPAITGNEPQLWAVLSRLSSTLCTNVAVKEWLGGQDGECGHGLGHAYYMFGIAGKDERLVEDVNGAAVSGSIGCWKALFFKWDGVGTSLRPETFSVPSA